MSSYNEVILGRVRYSKLFFVSLLIYSSCILFKYVSSQADTIVSVVSLIAIVSFCWSFVNLFEFDIEATFLRRMVICLIVWYVFVILRGLDLSYNSVREYLFNQYSFWPYLIPLSVFLVKSKTVYKYLFSLLYYSGIIFLILSSAFTFILSDKAVAEQFIWTFATGCGFMLLTWKYHSPNRRIVSVLVVVIALLFATILARRNIMLTLANFSLFGYLLNLIYNSRAGILQKVLSIFLITILSVFIFFYYQSNRDSSFKLISERATEDTRQYVFDNYFSDMSDADLLFGRGINGSYYCPISDVENGGFLEYRDVIECGFLQMILKGGLVSLLLFLGITVPAMLRGLFFSRNLFSKACGILILLWLIDMIPFGLPVISMRYILVWVAVGICYTNSIIKASESEVEFLFMTRS